MHRFGQKGEELTRRITPAFEMLLLSDRKEYRRDCEVQLTDIFLNHLEMV